MNSSICKAKLGDNDFLTQLWIKSFNENYNQEYLDFVFEKLANYKFAHIIVIDDNPVGMGFILPAKLDDESVFYLYSLAVEPDFRGKGLMTEFLQYAKEYARKNNISKLFLVPQNNALREYYKRRGYEDFSCFVKQTFDRNEWEKKIQVDEISTDEYLLKRNEFFRMYNIPKLCIFNELISIEEGLFFNQKIIRFPQGYAVLTVENEMIKVREVLMDYIHLDGVIQGLMYYFNRDKASILLSVALAENYSIKDKIPYTMICNLGSDISFNNVYSNFMLD